ncbi:hypothetical protein OAL58_04800 [Verrucomicrobia bacterium]|nr:hypothetical protein [Verrucomicrobiota bacterium]
MLTYVPGDADTQVAQNELENKLTPSHWPNLKNHRTIERDEAGII